MANCNTRYNNDKSNKLQENFDGLDVAKGFGWAILAIVIIAGIIVIIVVISKLSG